MWLTVGENFIFEQLLLSAFKVYGIAGISFFLIFGVAYEFQIVHIFKQNYNTIRS